MGWLFLEEIVEVLLHSNAVCVLDLHVGG